MQFAAAKNERCKKIHENIILSVSPALTHSHYLVIFFQLSMLYPFLRVCFSVLKSVLFCLINLISAPPLQILNSTLSKLYLY